MTTPKTNTPARSSLRRAFTTFTAAAAVSLSAHAHAAVIAHWSFDTTEGDKNFYPDADHAHPATPQDKSQVKPFDGAAPFGNAVFFNGEKTSFLTTPSIPAMHKTSLTVAAWVYLTKAHANFIITDWKATGEAAWVFGLDQPKSGSPLKSAPIADLRSPDFDTAPNRTGIHLSVARYAEGKKEVTLNEWHHVAWTWARNGNTGTLTAFLDGEQLGSAKQTHIPMDLTPTNHNVRIGGREANNFNMDGAIDELWVFNEVLKPDQIKNLMRFNKLADTGTLAGVLTKKPDGTFALVKVAPPAVDPRPMPPTPASPPTPVASGNNPPRTPRPPANNGNRPAPNVPPKPTPAPVVETPVQTTADEEPPEVVMQTLDTERPIAAIPVPSHYTSGRIAGIITCAAISLVLSGYLFWVYNERSKMRSS